MGDKCLAEQKYRINQEKPYASMHSSLNKIKNDSCKNGGGFSLKLTVFFVGQCTSFCVKTFFGSIGCQSDDIKCLKAPFLKIKYSD
jgi:hypothetical protein